MVGYLSKIEVSLNDQGSGFTITGTEIILCYNMICHCKSSCLADLSMAMQKIYQTFVALAAQLQSIHENVKVSHSSRCVHVIYKNNTIA